MDYVVPGRQIRVTGDPRAFLDIGEPPPLLLPAIYLGFCKNQKLDIGTLKPRRQLAPDYTCRARLRDNIKGRSTNRRDSFAFEKFSQPVASLFRRGHTDYPVSSFPEVLDLVNKIVDAACKYLRLFRLGNYMIPVTCQSAARAGSTAALRRPSEQRHGHYLSTLDGIDDFSGIHIRVCLRWKNHVGFEERSICLPYVRLVAI